MERQRLTDGEQSGHPFSSDTASKAPVGAISLAVGLLVGGMVLLIIGLALYNDPEAHSTPESACSALVAVRAQATLSPSCYRCGAADPGLHMLYTWGLLLLDSIRCLAGKEGLLICRHPLSMTCSAMKL